MGEQAGVLYTAELSIGKLFSWGELRRTPTRSTMPASLRNELSSKLIARQARFFNSGYRA